MGTTFKFIADDFGLDVETNDAMIFAHQAGVLDGAALMMGQPGTDSAIALARENPQLRIGWHLHVVDSQPLSLRDWPWASPAAAGFAIGFSRRAKALIRKEMAAQWQAFNDSGLECAFINAHHHMCIHPFIRQTLVDTVGEHFNGWLRWGRPCFFGKTQRAYQILDTLLQKPKIKALPFKTSAALWGIDRTFRMQPEEVAAKMAELRAIPSDLGIQEFMFHPRKKNDQDTRCLVELKTRYNAEGDGSALG